MPESVLQPAPVRTKSRAWRSTNSRRRPILTRSSINEAGSAFHAMNKPHAPACDRNRDPILAVLREHFADRRRVLEIGSGTGQHAVYFAKALAHLTWQTSDVAENIAGIRAWLD